MNIFFLFFAFMASSLASAQVTTEPLQIDRVFIPQGFDDNDNVQVVVTGTLKDTCWKVGESRFTKQENQISLEVEGNRKGCFCIPVEVPFHEVIDLGNLGSGRYDINIGSEIYRLSVTRSPTPSQDSRLYANVLSGYMTGDLLTLKGLHPDKSFYIKEIVISKQEDGTIVVMPIATRRPIIRDFVTVPFTQNLDLSPYIDVDQTHLIHVRSMNGNAINLVERFNQNEG